MNTLYIRLCWWLVLLPVSFCKAQSGDSVATLKKVTVSGLKKKSTFTAVTPLQSLTSETLQQLNAPSVGDAARYFSGVQVKDYGGVGGLKTVSVRSLGAAHTGILYDGIPVSDVQSGQVDLSRYSTTFVQSIDLQQGSPATVLQPARAYSSAAVLSINTPAMYAMLLPTNQWQAGLKAGSFGLWQPFGSMQLKLPKQAMIGLSSEAVFSKGNYPFHISNGIYSEDTKRQNAEMRSWQGEINGVKQFNDSSTLLVKFTSYHSSRGLPGAIVFFNEGSKEHLWNTDSYFQSRYRRSIDRNTNLLIAGKYSRNYTRYTDPDFLNNQGGLDNRYTQQEFYFAATIDHSIGERLTLAAASDAAYSTLLANLTNFAAPSRRYFWNNVAAHYNGGLWQLNGSLLLSTVNDKTATGKAAATINKLTPSIAGNLKLGENSPFMVRLFYKHIFRMPTFNDLYYNWLGNPDLRPEYARQYNAGLVFSKSFSKVLKQFNISADGYYNRVKDKIIAIPKNLFVWTMLNLGKVDIKGVDVNVEGAGELTGAVTWFTRLAYTWQQALDVTDKTSITYKNDLPYTPRHSGSGLVSLQYHQWSGGYSLLFSSTRYVLGENNPYNQLDGWGTQDAFVAWTKPVKTFCVQIRVAVDNVLNKQYDIVRYYPMPRRSFKLSLQLNNL